MPKKEREKGSHAAGLTVGLTTILGRDDSLGIGLAAVEEEVESCAAGLTAALAATSG
jgi:hypothetical protein